MDMTRANRAIASLREPNVALARVVNTVRQSLAEIIEELMAEIGRLNKWADGFSDAQLKERQLCEERMHEVQREERERCAKLAESFKPNLDDGRKNQDQLAALIRINS